MMKEPAEVKFCQVIYHIFKVIEEFSPRTDEALPHNCQVYVVSTAQVIYCHN